MILIWLRVTRRPQILHVPLTSFWAFWKDTAFILMARMLGMKVVAHLHGGVFDRYYRESPLWVQRLIGWSMTRANIVIALSDEWKRFLLEEVRPDLRVEVIPNSVDLAFAAEALRDAPSPHSSGAMVLFVGGLGQRKGVYDILKAIPFVVKHHPSVKFLFAGQEEAKGEWARIEKIRSESQLESHTQFLGCVTGAAKLQLFRTGTIFILPSHGENLPYALLEAMATGLPIISTLVGAIPEIVEEGCNGFLIEPGDDQALAEKISLLLGDMQLRAEMSRANREKIRREYLPEAAMARFDLVYKNLLEQERSARSNPLRSPEVKRRSP